MDGDANPAETIVVQDRRHLRRLLTVLRDPKLAWPAQVATAKLVVLHAFGRVSTFVCEPALIQQVLLTQADAFAKGRASQRALQPALGRGLITADGPHWRRQRQAAAPAFRHQRLVGFLPAMLDAAVHQRERWRATPPDSVVCVSAAMMRTTFDVIAATMLGEHSGQLDPARVEHDVNAYLDTTSWRVAFALLRAPAWMPHPGRRRAARATRRLRAALAALVARSRQRPGAAPDLLGLLLHAQDPESGQALDDTDLVDNLITFIAAGHETTALAMSWMFVLLAQHPDIEARVLAEIDAATAGALPDAQQLQALSYTTQVVQETLRLYPPAPIVERMATRDLTIGGHRIQAGQSVYVPGWAVHRRPSLWPDPERFDPNRFAPEAVRDRPRCAYLPFGAGPRICIGAGFAMQEMTAMLAVLLPAFRLRLHGVVPDARVRVTLRPSRPIMMRMSPRGLPTPAPDHHTQRKEDR